MELKGLIYMMRCVYMRRIPSSSTVHVLQVPALLYHIQLTMKAAVALLQMTCICTARRPGDVGTTGRQRRTTARRFGASSHSSVTVTVMRPEGSGRQFYQYDPAGNFSTLTQHWAVKRPIIIPRWT